MAETSSAALRNIEEVAHRGAESSSDLIPQHMSPVRDHLAPANPHAINLYALREYPAVEDAVAVGALPQIGRQGDQVGRERR